MMLEGEDHYCGHGVNDMKPIRLAVAVLLFSLSAFGADPNEKLIKELRAEYAYLLEKTKITPEERTRRRTRGKMSALAQALGGMSGRDFRAEILREELAAYQVKLQRMNTIMQALDSLTRQEVVGRTLNNLKKQDELLEKELEQKRQEIEAADLILKELKQTNNREAEKIKAMVEREKQKQKKKKQRAWFAGSEIHTDRARRTKSGDRR